MATGKPPYAHRWNDPAVTVDMMRSVKPSRGARRRARSCSLRNRERTFGDPESMLGSYIGTLVQRDCSEGGACYHGWLLYLRKNVMRGSLHWNSMSYPTAILLSLSTVRSLVFLRTHFPRDRYKKRITSVSLVVHSTFFHTYTSARTHRSTPTSHFFCISRSVSRIEPIEIPIVFVLAFAHPSQPILR